MNENNLPRARMRDGKLEVEGDKHPGHDPLVLD